MNDKALEWGLISLSIIALLWMVLGGIFGILNIAGVIIIGLVVWIIGCGALLYLWGKNYMSQM